MSDNEAAPETVKLNVTYDLGGKNPVEAAKTVRKALKEVLRSGEIEGFNTENATLEKSVVGEKWELELETGDEGCDCPVVVHVCGVKADEQPYTLKQETSKNQARRPFQPEQIDIFEVFIDDDIGDIFKLRFGFPADVPNAKWSLKALKLWHPKHNDMFKTQCNLSVVVSPNADPWKEVFIVWPDYPLLPVINYRVKVYTSASSGAMDCGVDMIIYGDYGNSGRRSLKKLTGHKTRFKPSEVEVFEVPIVKLGRITKVHVFNDLSSSNRTWFLDKIIIAEPSADSDTWEFPCRRYFDPEKGDHRSDRILEVGKAPEPEPKEAKAPAPAPAVPVIVPVARIADNKRPAPVVHKKQPSPAVTKPAPKPAEKTLPPNDLWEMWWENRKAQAIDKEVALVFVLVGDRSSSKEIPMVVDLKPGMSIRRKIVADADVMGELCKVRIRFADQVKHQTKWDIAKLHLKHLRTGEQSTFEFDRAIVQKATGDSTVEAATDNTIPVRTYICELYSGNRPGLLSNARVYVMIRGKRGDTGKRWIVNSAEGVSPLKKGQIVKYEIQCVDLGDIKGIRFGHDKRGKDASHYLEKIVVRPMHLADVQYVFEFASPTDEVDGETKAVVEPLPVPEQYDPHEWTVWWTSDPSQPRDFLQISITLVGMKGQSVFLLDAEIGPGESNVYTIKLEKDIGELTRVRLAHGPKVQGSHPWWKVAEMRLQNKATGQLFKFQPGQQMQAARKPDASVKPPQQKLPPLPNPTVPLLENQFRYRVEVYTSPSSVMLSNQPEYYIKFVGELSTSSELCWFGHSLTNMVAFRPGQVDVFDFVIEEDFGTVQSVRLGQKAQNKVTGVVFDKIVVRPLHMPGTEYVFDTGIEDGLKECEWLISWVCASSQPQLGQTAVVLVLYDGGRKPVSELSTTTMLRPGQSEELRCKLNDGADFVPYKVRIGFRDDSKQTLRWDVLYVKLRCVETRQLFTFTLQKGPVILSEDKDGWLEVAVDVIPNRTQPPVIEYQLDIYTGKELRGPPDSKVFVNLKGKRGDSGLRKLKFSQNNGYKNFQPGRMDSFRVEAVDVGQLRSLFIGHDESGNSPSWLLERVVLLNRRTGDRYEFVTNSWFDRHMADGIVQRRLRPTSIMSELDQSRKWAIAVSIANHPQAGTKTPLCLLICGRNGTSNMISLTMPQGLSPGGTYEFTISVELDDLEIKIGEVFKVRLGFLEEQDKPAVLIDHISLKELATGAEYSIAVREWVYADGKRDTWREFYAQGGSFPQLDVYKFQLSVWTSTEMNAETDCEVYAQIEGVLGNTGKRRLRRSLTHVKPFCFGQMDLFDLEALEVGEIQQISLTIAAETENDGKKWHLKRILLTRHPMDSQEIVFECDQWLDTAAHTRAFSPTTRKPRLPFANLDTDCNYLVFLTTGPEPENSKSVNVVLELFGEQGRFGPFLLNRPSGFNRKISASLMQRPFQPGSVEVFPIIVDEATIGRLIKGRLQNVGANPCWFLDKAAIYDINRPRAETYHLDVFDWLSSEYGDGDSVREFALEQIRQPVLKTDYFTIEIQNGPNGTPVLPGAVEAATCYIELFGKTPLTTGIRPLRKNIDKHFLLQPGKANVFSLAAVGVGEVVRIRLGHTAVSADFRWHVIQVSVSWNTEQRTFPCNQLLVKSPTNDSVEIILSNFVSNSIAAQ